MSLLSNISATAKSSSTLQRLIPWLVGLGGVLLFAILIYRGDYVRIGQVFIGLAVLVFAELLLFNKSVLFMALVALVPLSVKLEVGNAGLAIVMPSEGLAAIIMALFWFQALMRNTLHRRILTHPITILLAVDMLWLIIASSYSTMPDVSFKRILMRFCFVTVFYLLGSHWMQDRRNLKRIFLLYGAGLILAALYILKAHAAWAFTTKVAFSITQPLFDDHTVWGACLAFVLPFGVLFLRRWKAFDLTKIQRNWLFIGLMVLVFAEFVAYSRAAWLSLIAALLFGWLIKLRIKMTGIISLLALVTVLGFSFSDQLYQYTQQNEAVSNSGDVESQVKSVTNLQTDASNLERINRWVAAWHMFEEKPVTGFGPGTYQFEYAAFQESQFKTYISTSHGNRGNAHSEYLTYLCETGLPGFIIFIILVFTTIGIGLKVIYGARDERLRTIALGTTLGLLTFFVHGLFNSFIDQDKMAVLVFGSMGILVALDVFSCESGW